MNSIVELIATLIGALIGSIIAVGVVFLFSLIMAWPVEILWNAELPNLFGFKYIGFWDAWFILLLTGILFRSGKSTSNSSKS